MYRRYFGMSWFTASPLRVFLLVLALVFGVEASIMLLLAVWQPFPADSVAVAGVDAMLLTTVIAPAIWVLVVAPLRSLFEQRGRLLQKVYDVQEDERARIARDLHDELGQQLTAVLLGLRAIEMAEDREQAIARARGVAELAAGSLDSVRRLARGLSPAVLTELGLRAAVERLCEDVGHASGLGVTREIELDSERMTPAVEITAYRVLQEAMTNVVRHAEASTVVVRVIGRGDELVLEVKDDGKGLPDGRSALAGRSGAGADMGSSGLGLHGMGERVALMKGSISFESAPGKGTAVRVVIPKAGAA